MRISEGCVKCLYEGQCSRTDNEEYLSEVRDLLENRKEEDTSPYMIYQFNKTYERYFGAVLSYKDERRLFNDLVLDMENELKKEIERSDDPLATALLMSRIGNYIDYGALTEVNEKDFLELFGDIRMRDSEKDVYDSFLKSCAEAESFLLIADNCGEIVLDKLMLCVLHERFPELKLSVMVRGGEVLNDVTIEDALYVGLDEIAEIISNGEPVAGTIYNMLPGEARNAFDNADVVLAKGQGNYESLIGIDKPIYYMFLCKCDLFTQRFNVPKLTGMFVYSTGPIACGYDILSSDEEKHRRTT